MWLRNYSHFRERRVTLMLKVNISERPWRKHTGEEEADMKHSELNKTELPINIEGKHLQEHLKNKRQNVSPIKK